MSIKNRVLKLQKKKIALVEELLKASPMLRGVSGWPTGNAESPPVGAPQERVIPTVASLGPKAPGHGRKPFLRRIPIGRKSLPGTIDDSGKPEEQCVNWNRISKMSMLVWI